MQITSTVLCALLLYSSGSPFSLLRSTPHCDKVLKISKSYKLLALCVSTVVHVRVLHDTIHVSLLQSDSILL